MATVLRTNEPPEAQPVAVTVKGSFVTLACDGRELVVQREELLEALDGQPRRS